MHRHPWGVAALVVCLVGPALQAMSGGHHCQRCGCEAACQRICRSVCEQKKETVFETKCEDICVPGQSQCCGKSCQRTCDGKCVKVHNWIPQCGTVRTVTVL